ncbi:MAG: FMN-binding domain protein [Actinomycetia bacterium]|jgi:uncharacterized protein with FMN-binding domain|nr:FMN-binding domain protein [Actinomycetes bacterium]
MNRAIPGVIITTIGLGALASFRSSSGLPVKSSTAVVVPRKTVPASTAPPSRGTAATTPTTTPASTTPGTTPATSTQTRTITGTAVDNQYGTVQVQVTLHGTQITDIVAVQMPNSHQRSIEISQGAEPILRQEALQSQSAQIDIVSGASFTSQSYAESLQGALDQANR